MKNTLTVHCPNCGKAHAWQMDNKARPFCSERCKLIDLGAWAGEAHRIAGDPLQDDLLSHINEDADKM